MPNLFINIPVPAGNGVGVAVDVSSLGLTKTIVLGGNLSGTVNIEYATDSAGTVFAPLATFQSPGGLTVEVAAHWLRAITSGYRSGSANADVGALDAQVSFSQLVVPAGNGVGAPAAIDTLPAGKTVVVGGGFTGSLVIEVSEDGVDYAQVFSFYSGGGQSATFYGAFARVRRDGVTGGATPSAWMAGAPGGGAGGCGGGVAENPILWAPGGGGDATTWAEVMGFVQASRAPLTVYVNANATIPAGTYEVNGLNFVSDPTLGALLISMDDDVFINNLGSVGGLLTLRSNSTSSPPLTFDAAIGGAPDAILLNFNGALENVGLVPMIAIPAGAFYVIPILGNGGLLATTAPVIDVGAGATFILGVIGSSQISNDAVSGDPTATMIINNAGGAPSPLPTNASFLGTTIQNILTGASCTGVAARPVNPLGSLPIGAMVFDQSLGLTGKPIWWDGTQWVDATGAPA